MRISKATLSQLAEATGFNPEIHQAYNDEAAFAQADVQEFLVVAARWWAAPQAVERELVAAASSMSTYMILTSLWGSIEDGDLKHNRRAAYTWDHLPADLPLHIDRIVWQWLQRSSRRGLLKSMLMRLFARVSTKTTTDVAFSDLFDMAVKLKYTDLELAGVLMSALEGRLTTEQLTSPRMVDIAALAMKPLSGSVTHDGSGLGRAGVNQTAALLSSGTPGATLVATLLGTVSLTEALALPDVTPELLLAKWGIREETLEQARLFHAHSSQSLAPFKEEPGSELLFQAIMSGPAADAPSQEPERSEAWAVEMGNLISRRFTKWTWRALEQVTPDQATTIVDALVNESSYAFNLGAAVAWAEAYRSGIPDSVAYEHILNIRRAAGALSGGVWEPTTPPSRCDMATYQVLAESIGDDLWMWDRLDRIMNPGKMLTIEESVASFRSSHQEAAARIAGKSAS